MKLGEVQEWLESGKSADDAAAGLLFEAVSLAIRTHGRDEAIPLLFAASQICVLMSIAEELRKRGTN